MPEASLAVESPEIEEVLDLVTGEHRPAATVIGDDYARAIQLRLQLRTGIRADDARYRCAICNIPVYLVSRCDTRRFFFRHTLEDGRCTAHTRGALSQDEIDARKYNGAKESAAHRQMKMWVAQCLEADPRFSDVRVEAPWRGALTGEYRRPDVRATLGSKDVAFEIQLSTTHLNVIAERRYFYLREGGLLFWIFKTFDSDGRRLTHDDVFFNNNQNAFVVSKKTVDLSIGSGGFYLDCIWAKPTSPTESSALQRKFVSFHELTLDFEKQQAFYYDFEGERKALERAELERAASLRREFEAFWLPFAKARKDEDGAWKALRAQFRILGLKLPLYPNQLPVPLLNALYSAKQGRPTGWGFKKLVEVAHQVAGGHKQYLGHFRKALAAFDRGAQLSEEDKTGKWQQKVAAYKAAIKGGSQEYAPDSSHDALVAILFPELESRPEPQ